MSIQTTSYPKEKINILFLENISDKAVQQFKQYGYVNVKKLNGALSEDELIEAVKDVHLLGIRSKTQITEKVIQSAKKLQAIGCFCIGVNQVNLKAATKNGIVVFNAPYSNTRSVAELIIGLSIMLIRRIPDKNKAAHESLNNKFANLDEETVVDGPFTAEEMIQHPRKPSVETEHAMVSEKPQTPETKSDDSAIKSSNNHQSKAEMDDRFKLLDNNNYYQCLNEAMTDIENAFPNNANKIENCFRKLLTSANEFVRGNIDVKKFKETSEQAISSAETELGNMIKNNHSSKLPIQGFFNKIRHAIQQIFTRKKDHTMEIEADNKESIKDKFSSVKEKLNKIKDPEDSPKLNNGPKKTS